MNMIKVQTLIVTFLIACVFTLTACGKREAEIIPCDPLPVVDGHVFVKVKDGDFTLRLPYYANPNRSAYGDRAKECQYLKDFSIMYLWYQGKLIPEGTNRFKVPKTEYRPVTIYFLNDAGAGLVKNLKKPPEKSWRFDGALKHKKFPLEFYPKFEWDDPVNPSPQALQSAKFDQTWGIVGTKYKSILTNQPFTAFCDIPPLTKANPDSRIESDFADVGDSKCRGGVIAERDGKYVGVMIDVWAYKGNPSHQAIREINQIYDAVVEELKTFIQE